MALTVILLPDTSPTVGLGHFYRCLRLGIAIRAAGYRARMICASLSPWMRGILKKHRIGYTQLPTVASKEVVSFLRKLPAKPSWIVTDHYKLSLKWERVIKSYVGRIAVFDDADGRHHDCDLLINAALPHERARSRYRRKISPRTTLLLGPRYALPTPQIERFSRVSRKFTPVRSICFFLGGSAPKTVYKRYLKSLIQSLPPSVERIICITPTGMEPLGTSSMDQRITVVPDYSSLNRVFETIDLFIGSGGTISYDRIAAGIPGLVVSMAANQVGQCRYFARLGTQVYLGDYRTVKLGALAHHASLLMGNSQALRAMRAACRSVVDGRGAARIIRALRETRLP